MEMDVRNFNKGARGPGVGAPTLITGDNTPKAQLGENKITPNVPAMDTTVVETPLTDIPAEVVQKMVIREYREFLAEEGIGDEDIFAVLDALITTGQVSWNFTIFGKIPVEFRMRSAWVNDYILAKLESDFPKSAHRFADMVGGYNLAASLRSYGDVTYEASDADALIQVHKVVMDMPYAIQNALVKKLAVFDRVVAAATSDWAVENFMKPQEGE